ncbi:hypothetical protein C8T65DRAFT_526276, partial [Cerioporus squamosus]
FFEAFCTTNNLKCMLSAGTLPPILEQFATLLDDAFTGEDLVSDDAATMYADDSEPRREADERKVSQLPAALYRTLLECIRADKSLHHSSVYCSTYDDSPQDRIVLNAMAEPLSYVQHRGKRFSTAVHCEADSHVIYRAPPKTNRLVLGRIEKLFVHKRRCIDGEFHHQVFAVMRQYSSLSEDDSKHDPYRRYAGLRASLVYESLSRNVEVVPMRDVTAHFVTCPYDDGGLLSRPCIVALPLDQ